MTLVRIQIRRGTAQQWIDINPILSSGEQGLETDTGREKVGNGVDAWTDLPYVTSFSTENINPIDSTDNSVFFPVFVSDTGNNTPRIKKTITAGSTVFSFNPSTSLLRVGGTVEATTFTGNSATTTRWLNDRTVTIGATGKTVNGTANVSWSLSEIGAAAVAQTMHIGTTAVNINRPSGNLALAGISSLALPGATSGTITLTPTAVAGTTTLTLPATTGTVALTSNIGNGTLTVDTSGVGLSSSGTFTANQSGNSTVTITSNATSSNTANTIVSRDGSGNFTAASVTLQGQLTLRSSATTSAATQFPVFTANPASTSQLLVTRTPAQVLSDIGAYAATNPAGYTTNTGTVTSVSGTGTVSGITLSGTVNNTGNLTLGGTLSVTPSNFASQTANTFLAAPNGTAGVPAFRAIVAADVPILNQNTTGNAASASTINATAITTNANFFPVFVSGTGNQTPNIRTTSTAFTFNPSTSTLTLAGPIAAATSTNTINGLVINSGALSNITTISASGTTTAGKFTPTANTVTGNGMYLPTTNTLAFSTNGAERARITSAGYFKASNNAAYSTTSTEHEFRQSVDSPILSLNSSNTSYTNDALFIFVNSASNNNYNFINTSNVAGTRFSVAGNGDVFASGEITAFFSDERLKTKTGNIDGALGIVSKLSTFKYVPNELAKTHGFDDTHIQLGLSAQEVEKVLPEVIRIAPFDQDRDDVGNLISKSGENYLTLDYAKLVPVLIEAIKELEQKVNDLTTKLENN